MTGLDSGATASGRGTPRGSRAATGLRLARLVGIAVLVWLASANRAEAQLGALISPGKLAKGHAALEGIANCQKCHEQGQKVTAVKCLACHAPVADRINRKVGVHKDVKNDCAVCHAEHGGVDGELRPFDQAHFDHAAVTGFPLTGKHALGTSQCAACHKVRSFLTLSSTCVSCHADVHKGSLGPDLHLVPLDADGVQRAQWAVRPHQGALSARRRA